MSKAKKFASGEDLYRHFREKYPINPRDLDDLDKKTLRWAEESASYADYADSIDLLIVTFPDLYDEDAIDLIRENFDLLADQEGAEWLAEKVGVA